MPPRAKYTREEITEIALGIVAESGAESLNARSLAEAMGTSTPLSLQRSEIWRSLKALSVSPL